MANEDTLSNKYLNLKCEGQNLLPEFEPGDQIRVDPEIPAKPGDYVIAKLDRHKYATLCKYHKRDTDISGNVIIELVPVDINQETFKIDSTEPGLIIGTVVTRSRFFR